MRIIAGELRGRRLEAPAGRGTRPMLDRVREALFSSVTPWLAGGRVLDLFAGSGCLSFEALSRGADRARLVENGALAVAAIEANRAELGLRARTDLVRGDALAPASWGPEGEVDLVFYDPPYPLLDEAQTRAELLEALEHLVLATLAEEGLVVFHAPRRKLVAADFPASFEVRERVYGSNSLWYVQGPGA